MLRKTANEHVKVHGHVKEPSILFNHESGARRDSYLQNLDMQVDGTDSGDSESSFREIMFDNDDDGSSDSKVEVWNEALGETVPEIPDSESSFREIMFDNDDDGSSDSKVEVWNEALGETVPEIPGQITRETNFTNDALPDVDDEMTPNDELMEEYNIV
eukprot:gene21181-23255_t